jgi:uncharacterized protein YbjT (DUF2867 family)
MILIVGGTGNLGRHLVDVLGALDEIRVLTRDPARAAGLRAQLIRGDVRDAESTAAAVQGCSMVISAMHGFVGGHGAGPAAVDRDGNANLINAAAKHGVERFILVSVMGAAPDHPMSLFRTKYAAEQSIRETSMAWTIVRPSSYLQTWIEVIGGKLATGGPMLVFGRGENPINFVSARNVAGVIATVLANPAYSGSTIDVGGPDNITLNAFAREIAAGQGVAGRIRRIPRAALRIMSSAAQPVAPALARQAKAALTMDTADMTFDAAALRQQFPEIGWESLAEVIEHLNPHPGEMKHEGT